MTKEEVITPERLHHHLARHSWVVLSPFVRHPWMFLSGVHSIEKPEKKQKHGFSQLRRGGCFWMSLRGI